MDEDKKITGKIATVRDLNVNRKAFEVAMQIFDVSKNFPKEERFSLIDQIRRSSRSVCANLAEGWRKRKYKAVFLNKLSDCEAEAAETQIWLEFAHRCGYINDEQYRKWDEEYEHIFAMLITMGRKVESFCK